MARKNAWYVASSKMPRFACALQKAWVIFFSQRDISTYVHTYFLLPTSIASSGSGPLNSGCVRVSTCISTDMKVLN